MISDPNLQGTTTPDAATTFAIHPVQLSRWLEEVWARGGIANWPQGSPTSLRIDNALGDPAITGRLRLPDGLRNDTLRSGIRPTPPTPPTIPPDFMPSPPAALGLDLQLPLPWEHLFYAYLVESTGIVEIMSEVVRRYVVGETLPTPSVDTVVWVRATEELFFRDPPLFHIGGLTSQLRPDAQVNRRNAYWRMFGCDLPHPPRGPVDGQPWKRDTGPGANLRFIELWTELLRQVWVGIENDRNSSGANPTDANYVGYLCQTIGELLRLRRRNGLLAREEFAYVTMLSWFHLTVEFDTPVVRDLSAGAGLAGGNPADRLTAIGARVGITPPRHARELFELADLVSPLLWFIELDQFSAASNAELLYRLSGTPNPPLQATMARIIDLWQSATGDRIKDLAVSVRRSPAATQSAQPVRLPAPSAAVSPSASAQPFVTPSTNGSVTAPRA
ncbi:hypothetical protein [Streptosporangium carneum]|uniref:hypothetical protein n=1 Tax=Streptosporangium carneum TaxID=47481 RepID=UPI0022F2EC15|nr:hypothetical protein [Streptosporangium carneum]